MCLFISCVQVSNDPIENTRVDGENSARYVLANVTGRSAETHYLRARAFLELGELENAHRELTNEVMQRSVDARYSFLLGKVSYLQGNYTQAQKHLRDALELGFNQPELFRLLANTYMQLGFNSRALATTERLLTLDQTPENESLKGTVLLSLGDTARAVEYFTQSMGKDSSLVTNYHELLNVYLTRKQTAPARILIDRYLSRYPADLEMLSRKGTLLMQQNNYARARVVFDTLMQLEPRNPFYLQQHSKAYFLEGRYDSALIQARRALVLDENDVATRVIVAESLENQRLFDEARDVYARLLASDSSIVAAREGYDRIIRRENYLRYLRQQEQKKQEMPMPDLTPITPNN